MSRHFVRSLAVSAASVVVVLSAGLPVASAQGAGVDPADSGAVSDPAPPQPPVQIRKSCDTDPQPGFARCHAQVNLSGVTARSMHAMGESALALPGGFGTADIQSAYGLNAPKGQPGTGPTVAIVDAYNNPNVEADLATYRSTYGLGACTSANGCFRKLNQNGATSPLPASNIGWGEEIDLDVDMVSATCPNCKILLIEASGASFSSLGTAENTATRLGAIAISNSYGGGEWSGETAVEAAYYNHRAVAITASSGDSGYGVEFPAASQYVTAVGGTSLVPASNARGWSERAWSGAGAGCSAFIAKPTWQTDAGCPRRTVADVSAVADPATGVAAYDTFGDSGWLVFGGTSVASPIVASVYALQNNPLSISYGAYPYSHTSGLWDIVSGADGACTPSYLCIAGPGYDGPTGLGTPHGVSGF